MELRFPLVRKMLASILFELKRKLRLSDLLLCKIVLARKMPLCGNKGLYLLPELALVHSSFQVIITIHKLEFTLTCLANICVLCKKNVSLSCAFVS